MRGGEIGRLMITSPTGKRLRFDGSWAGLFSPWPVVDSASPPRTVTYGYDGSGNLQTVTDLRQQPTTYSYATPANHLLTRIRNAMLQDVEQITYNTASPPQVATQILQNQQSLVFTFP